MKRTRLARDPKAIAVGAFFCRAVAMSTLIAGVFASPRAFPQERAGPASKRHVVLLSFDGFRPDFYLEPRFDTPNLRALAARGAMARAVEPAFPSCTYPGHASIVTGMRPARHAIIANSRFDEHGAEPEWLWEADLLKAKPIWRAAHEQGLDVAITNWPTTVGAAVDWLVPERWGVRGESTRDLLLKYSTPGLLVELGLALGVPDLGSTKLADRSKIDEWIAGAAAHMLRSRQPSLTLAHLIQVDAVEHAEGREGPSVAAAVHRVDACIGLVVAAAKEAGILDDTIFCVVGDHGFTDATTNCSPNVLLARAGLVTVDGENVASWRALGHGFGGSMAIYAKDEESSTKARELLEKNAVSTNGKRLYRIVSREESDRLGADPNAAFYLDAGDEVALYGPVTGAFSSESERHGVHGGISTKPQLATGFVIAGPGVRHTELAHMRLIDVAPTLAKLLHIDLRDTDGGVVPVLTEQPD